MADDATKPSDYVARAIATTPPLSTEDRAEIVRLLTPDPRQDAGPVRESG